MKISAATTTGSARLRAALGALLLLAVAAVALPGGTAAEEASQPGFPAAGQLDAGRNHSCAVMTEGVRCWGFGGEGELGYGNTRTIGDSETAGTGGVVNLGAGLGAASISAGDFHTCAELTNGAVRCWGYGPNGRLGTRSTANIGDTETPGSIPPVNLGTGRTATSVSAGASHTCALLDDATVRCWGYGELGALGYGGEVNTPASPNRPPDIGDDETPAAVGPVNFGPGRTALAITAGGYHTCALLNGGEVRCWGYGFNGQLGYGEAVSVSDPSTRGAVNLGAGRTAVAISAGDLHTCAILDDGSVRCWGNALEGRLGNVVTQAAIGDNELPSSQPTVDLGPGRTARAISAGEAHTCVLLDDGSVRCWGNGRDGRLGFGATSHVADDESPASVGPVSLGAARSAVAVSAGDRHTCARLDGGVDVLCWGYGANGRLGYCNQRNVGDDELPSAVGPVPLRLAVSAPSNAYPGCVRAASGVTPAPAPKPTYPAAVSPLAAQAERRRAFRSCLARAARHTRRETRRARRASPRRRAQLRRHIKRHRSRLRRACVRRHGRTPGRVSGLQARAASRQSVVVSFRAAGTDGDKPPAARSYVVKQSLRPIRSRRAFRRAQTLCRGRCRFVVEEVGTALSLRVTDLRRRTRYYYAVAARDNVSRKLGPRSRSVGVRTR